MHRKDKIHMHMQRREPRTLLLDVNALKLGAGNFSTPMGQSLQPGRAPQI